MLQASEASRPAHTSELSCSWFSPQPPESLRPVSYRASLSPESLQKVSYNTQQWEQ